MKNKAKIFWLSLLFHQSAQCGSLLSVNMTKLTDFPTNGNAGITSYQTVNNKIYFVGGWKADDNGYPSDCYNHIWALDLASLSWTNFSFTLPYEIGDANKAVFINNHLYVTPGFATGDYNGWGSHNKLIDVNLSSNSAIETNALSSGSIWSMISCQANGYIYFFGGHNGSDQREILQYNPSTSSLVQVTNMLNARNCATATLGSDGWIYIMGDVAAIERFNPVTYAVQSMNSVMPPVFGPDQQFSVVWHVPAENSIYFAGGPRWQTNLPIYKFDYAQDVLTNTGVTLPGTNDTTLYYNIGIRDANDPYAAYVLMGTSTASKPSLFRARLVTSGSALSSIPNTNILETVPWQYTPTVTGSGYAFGLSNAPSGMTVGSSSGTISWTPTEAQGPSTNTLTYAVSQSGFVVAWTNFTVTVLESNLPPAFTNWPGTQTVYATTTLNVQISSTDPDFPANNLTYALVSPPPGVGINPSTGLFTWTPTTGEVGTSNITVSVTDFNPWAVNSQHLSVTNSFQVQVYGLTPPSFTQQPTNSVVGLGQGFMFTSAATGFPAPSYQWQFSTNGVTWVNLTGATGAAYSLTASGQTNIGYYQMEAYNSQGTNFSSAARLTFLNIAMYAGLDIYGPVGSSYLIQSTPNLGSNWTTLTNVALPSDPYVYIDYTSPTNSKQFYRANPQ